MNLDTSKIQVPDVPKQFVGALLGYCCTLPWLLPFLGRMHAENEHVLTVIWAFHAVCLVTITYKKWHLHTWQTWLEQQIIYAIFAMGAFHLFSIHTFLDLAHRPWSQSIWYSLTFFMNTAFMAIDDSDYKKKAEKEEKKEGRKRKIAEEAFQQKKEKDQKNGKTVDTKTRIAANLIFYVGGLFWCSYYGYHWYIRTVEKIEMQDGRRQI